MLFDFLLFGKIGQKNRIKFGEKKEIKCAKTFEMLTVQGLIWAEHKFNFGITGLINTEKISMTLLVLVARTRQQSKRQRRLF